MVTNSTDNISDCDTITITVDDLPVFFEDLVVPDTSLINTMASGTIPTSTFGGTYNYGNVTISNGTNTGALGSNYVYTTNGPSVGWGTSHSGLKVNGDAEFDGDVKIRGRSLEKMLEKIEDRLAILQEPDPAKLEKYAALKKAYDHYKTLERLIGDD